jgi:hypothetical protein
MDRGASERHRLGELHEAIGSTTTRLAAIRPKRMASCWSGKATAIVRNAGLARRRGLGGIVAQHDAGDVEVAQPGEQLDSAPHRGSKPTIVIHGRAAPPAPALAFGVTTSMNGGMIASEDAGRASVHSEPTPYTR